MLYIWVPLPGDRKSVDSNLNANLPYLRTVRVIVHILRNQNFGIFNPTSISKIKLFLVISKHPPISDYVICERYHSNWIVNPWLKTINYIASFAVFISPLYENVRSKSRTNIWAALLRPLMNGLRVFWYHITLTPSPILTPILVCFTIVI